MNKLNYELHLHTEESKNDSAASVSDMLSRMKELGVKKCAITEHGVVSSYDTALAVGKELGIDVILGVEAYVHFQDSLEGRCHMCLFSKDEIGNTVLFQAVSDSNLKREKSFPIMDAEIFSTYFMEGKEGHGHIIASSACISGILSNVLRQNSFLEERIQKAQKKVDSIGYEPVDEDAILAVEQHIEALSEEINSLKKIADKKYVARRKKLAKLEGTKEYAAAAAALDAEEKESQDAAIRLVSLKEEKAIASKSRTALNQAKRNALSKEEKAKKYLSEIEFCKNSIQTEEEIYQLAKRKAAGYETVFGKGNFFIELQYHGMPEEAEVMPKLAKIASELHIPVVITNDAHMIVGGEESVRARQIMRSIRGISEKKPAGTLWQEAGVADKELYIKTEDELREMLGKILPESIVEEGIHNRGVLLEQCEMVINKKSHYPKYPQEIPGESSEDCLRRKVKEGIQVRFPDGLPNKQYQDRIDYELDIMCSMGFADYHLIVADYVKYGKLVGKFDFNHLPEGFEEHKFDIAWLEEKSKGLLGLGIGPGRGSAAGSLVCYLLGITDIEPIHYDLLFERFLNPERVSMPDIDTDFAPHLREIAYEYVAHLYSETKVCRILTRSRQQSKAVIDNCSKLLGDHLYKDKAHFNAAAGILKSMVCDGCLPSRDEVVSKFKGNKEVLRIYDDACLVNGTFTFYGVHPAGVVISDGEDVKKHVPLMYDDAGMKAQCDMVQVEECHGLLKMDFLGLKNLNIITDIIRMVQRNYGISIDIDHLPFEDEVFSDVYTKGFTNGVFQVESQGMKQMLQQAQPKTIEDVIILISMYRPGPMDFLDDLIQVMNGRKEAEFLVPELKPILGKTYGAIVYQEQVMRIFQDLAGYSLGGADMVRRFMSKKKMDKLVHEKQAFLFGDKDRGISGCVNNGIPEEKAKTLFDQMTEFAKYAFNKSHATVYAEVSYKTAYLKYHYPKEFLAVSLGYVESNKRKGYVADAKELGINVFVPDINISEAEFMTKDGNIYFGLKYVLNVSSKADVIVEERRKNGPYKSLADFCARTLLGGNAVEHLILSGAFDHIQTESRTALVEGFKSFEPTIKLISDKRKKLADPKSSEKTKENARVAIQNAIDVLEMTAYSSEPEDMSTKLRNEAEFLGIMLSGHPCNDYPAPAEVGAVPVENLTACKYTSTIGAVMNLRYANRNSDGKKMAFFDLDAPTGTIPVCVFAQEFEKFEGLIEEGEVLKISGSVSEKEDFSSSEDESGEVNTHLEMIAKKIGKIPKKKKKILLYAPNWTREEWKAFRKEMERYIVKDGYPLHIYEMANNRFFAAGFNVSGSLLSSEYETRLI